MYCTLECECTVPGKGESTVPWKVSVLYLGKVSDCTLEGKCAVHWKVSVLYLGKVSVGRVSVLYLGKVSG